MSDVATELGCGWYTVNDAVLAWGETLLAADTERVGSVEALGLDETLFARHSRWRTRVWCTSIVDVCGGQLLDIVAGRDAQAACIERRDQRVDTEVDVPDNSVEGDRHLIGVGHLSTGAVALVASAGLAAMIIALEDPFPLPRPRTAVRNTASVRVTASARSAGGHRAKPTRFTDQEIRVVPFLGMLPTLSLTNEGSLVLSRRPQNESDRHGPIPCSLPADAADKPDFTWRCDYDDGLTVLSDSGQVAVAATRRVLGLLAPYGR